MLWFNIENDSGRLISKFTIHTTKIFRQWVLMNTKGVLLKSHAPSVRPTTNMRELRVLLINNNRSVIKLVSSLFTHIIICACKFHHLVILYIYRQNISRMYVLHYTYIEGRYRNICGTSGLKHYIQAVKFSQSYK